MKQEKVNDPQLRQSHSTPANLICRIDVTAFAAVMFALVAMFLLPATVVVDSPRTGAQMPVDLPHVSTATEMRGADREDALVVAITRDGQVWFDTDQVSPENLTAAIRERVGHGAERKVYIRADMRARYDMVVRVLSKVRAAGIDKVAFIAGERNVRPHI
jgi:biopolymer transport protein ExbD/biopolymer transport protein TolR